MTANQIVAVIFFAGVAALVCARRTRYLND